MDTQTFPSFYVFPNVFQTYFFQWSLPKAVLPKGSPYRFRSRTADSCFHNCVSNALLPIFLPKEVLPKDDRKGLVQEQTLVLQMRPFVPVFDSCGHTLVIAIIWVVLTCALAYQADTAWLASPSIPVSLAAPSSIAGAGAS